MNASKLFLLILSHLWKKTQDEQVCSKRKSVPNTDFIYEEIPLEAFKKHLSKTDPSSVQANANLCDCQLLNLHFLLLQLREFFFPIIMQAQNASTEY